VGVKDKILRTPFCNFSYEIRGHVDKYNHIMCSLYLLCANNPQRRKIICFRKPHREKALEVGEHIVHRLYFKSCELNAED
jgi:hypothetical protein